MNRAVIVASGYMQNYSLFQQEILPSDTVICADGGIRHLIALQRKPDIFFGDFDSCDYDEIVSHPLMEGVPIKRFHCMKDKTDTELAIDYALSEGYSSLLLLGVTGTRLDQTLASISLLKKIHQQGAEGVILDDHNCILLVCNQAEIPHMEGYRLSLLALTPQVEGLSTEGLLYPLENFTLEYGSSRGISNEFIAETAKIKITNGLLLVVMSKD